MVFLAKMISEGVNAAPAFRVGIVGKKAKKHSGWELRGRMLRTLKPRTLQP